jgi:hypothetical protein
MNINLFTPLDFHEIMLTQQLFIKKVCTEFQDNLTDGLVADWRTDVISTHTHLILLCKEHQSKVLLLTTSF